MLSKHNPEKQEDEVKIKRGKAVHIVSAGKLFTAVYV